MLLSFSAGLFIPEMIYLVGENAGSASRWKYGGFDSLDLSLMHKTSLCFSTHIKSLCMQKEQNICIWMNCIDISIQWFAVFAIFPGSCFKTLIIHYVILKETEIIGFSVACLHI